MDHENKPNNPLFNNRIGMRPSRNLSAKEELDRIAADSKPNATAPTGTGDIVFGGGVPAKKSKKPLVLAVLVVLAVIAAVVSVVVTSGGNGGGKNDVGTVRAAFNNYANYLLYGKESNEDITADKYSTGSLYYQTEIETNSKSAEEYKNKLEEYFKKSEEKYNRNTLYILPLLTTSNRCYSNGFSSS